MSNRKQGRFGKGLYTVFFMLAVSVVFISVLALIYTLSRERILLNQGLDLKRAVLYAAGIEVPEKAAGVEELYQRRVEEVLDAEGNYQYFKIKEPASGTILSYVIMTRGAGLWGLIVSVVGVDEDLQTLTGIDFIEQSETPGLGARIGEDWFRNQFRGKEGPLSHIPEGEEAGRKQFQAITGASYTTDAVRQIVNTVLKKAPEIVKEGS